MTDHDAKLFWMRIARWMPCLLCRGAGHYSVRVRRHAKGTLMEVFFPDETWDQHNKECPHCKGLGSIPIAREWSMQ